MVTNFFSNYSAWKQIFVAIVLCGLAIFINIRRMIQYFPDIWKTCNNGIRVIGNQISSYFNHADYNFRSETTTASDTNRF